MGTNAPTPPLKWTGSGRGLPDLSVREPVKRPPRWAALRRWVFRVRVLAALPFLLLAVLLLPEAARPQFFNSEP